MTEKKAFSFFFFVMLKYYLGHVEVGNLKCILLLGPAVAMCFSGMLGLAQGDQRER